MVTVSVVMSVYNAEKYLKKAVDSILNQTFYDFEFIIIEDGSTDTSLQILEKFAEKDPRIVLIRKEKNSGLKGFIGNLNLGLEKAQGKFIARMDADDIALPFRFEKQVQEMEKDPELFIIGSSMELIDENDSQISVKKAFATDREIKAAMYKNIALYHPTIMFRNDPAVRYRGKIYYCEDYDLYFRLMLQNRKMANIPEVLLKYRILTTSVSRKDKTFVRWMMVEKTRSFYRETLKYGKDSYNGFVPEEIQKIPDPDHKNAKEDLLFAASTALKFNMKDELKAVLQKLEKYYPEQSTAKFRLLASMPYFFSKMYSKMLS